MVTADRRRPERGFTLIELLIATAIAGMVIGIASLSFSLFSGSWGRVSADHGERLAQLQRMELVEASVRAAVPWLVRDQRDKPGYYFLGREEGMTLVTTRAVFAPGELAVIRLFREQESAGAFRLVYEEAPLDGLTLEKAEQILPFKHRVVVVRGLSDLRFRYFGWESIGAYSRAQEDSAIMPLWYDGFDGLIRGMHPSRIGISLGDNEFVYFIPESEGYADE